MWKVFIMNFFITNVLAASAAQILADSLKSKISTVLDWFSEQFVVSVEIRNTDEAFEWVEFWLDSLPYAKTSRRLLLSTHKGNEGNNFEPYLFLTPAPGHHVFYYKDSIIWLNRNTNEGTAKPDSSDGYSSLIKPKESFHLTLLGRSQKTIQDLVDDIQKTAQEMLKQKPKFYTSIFGSWYDRHDINEKPIASVILPNKMEQTIIKDLKWFFDSADWYKERGIPYRRGYLFWGQNGSGKSSLSMALAGELGLNLYMLNLNAARMTDDSLLDMIHSVKDRSLILFEDIDVVQPRRKDGTKDAGEKVSLSGLLNVIDGPSAREGCVIIMTTNYKDRLDPALIRAGRADVCVEFTYATVEQIYRFYERFYNGKTTVSFEYLEALCKDTQYSMADIQQKLIENRTDQKGFLHALEPTKIKEEVLCHM